MDRRTLRRFALATTLWVAAVALVPAHFALTICRFAGLVHFDAGGPCCAGIAPREAPSGPRLDEQRCCSLRTVHLQNAPVERHTTSDAFALPAPAPALMAVVAPPPARPTRPPLRRLALGPPLILAKQSFLL